jgi:hypothetical protein
VDLDYNTFAFAIAALYSFLFMPFYRYILRYVANYYQSSQFHRIFTIYPTHWTRPVKIAYTISFILPMLNIVLFVKPMCKDILVPLIMDEQGFQWFRVCMIFATAGFRLALLRPEV